MSTKIEKLYSINFSLLLAHEIDSAFWREWELFHLPAGIQGFVVIHIFLILAFLYGFRQIILQTRTGLWFSLAMALAGSAGVIIHTIFLISGDKAFTLPVSLAVLTAMAVISILQLACTIPRLKRKE